MASFQVSRSVQINASPEAVFNSVADYGTWTKWSPWLCAEPKAEVRVRGDGSSVGSIYSWKGEIVGEGEIEHRQLEPRRLIVDELRFAKPFRSQSRVSFEMAPDTDSTRLTWNMQGSLPWFMFWLRPMMETMIGMDYERGLKMLKEWIESGQVCSKTEIHGVATVGPLRVAGVRGTCPINEVGASMQAAFSAASQSLEQHQLPVNGELISVYHKVDWKNRTFDYTSGYAIPDASSVPDELSIWSLPTVKALRVEHIGSYDHLGNGWSAAMQYARYKKLKQSRQGTFEIYRNDPRQAPPEQWRTDIYLPLRG